jgi:hypothetical protein
MAMLLLNHLDTVEPALAKLRSGTVTVTNFDGWAYADGQVSEHAGETITIEAQQEMPMFVWR